MADVKDAVSSKVMEVIDATKETLQSSMEAARSAVTSSVEVVRDSGVGQTAVSADDVMETTEDDSLPIGNEELGKETSHVMTCNGSHQTGDGQLHSSPRCSGMGLMGTAMLEVTWLLVQGPLILVSSVAIIAGQPLRDALSFLSQTGSS